MRMDRAARQLLIVRALVVAGIDFPPRTGPVTPR